MVAGRSTSSPLDLIPDVLPLLGVGKRGGAVLGHARSCGIDDFRAGREWGGAVDVEGHPVEPDALPPGSSDPGS
jgi:hypothetical protein